MSVIHISAAMEHTYAEPEDESIVQICLDAAEDSAQAFLQRKFYADDLDLVAAKNTVPALRANARAEFRAAMDAASTGTDCDTRHDMELDAATALNDALTQAQMIQNGLVIKPAIVAACLLITGHLFANREDVVTGVSVTELPNGADALLWPSRIGLGV